MDVMSSSIFRAPLGIALSGGGALGSWQSAALLTLEKAGLSFAKATGFSAGALNATFYFLGRTEETVERWRETDGGILRFSPRLSPLSLFDGAAILERLGSLDDAPARKKGRCELTIISAHRARTKPVYGRFHPGNGGPWDEPLATHLKASCSIPVIFPPVSLRVQGEDASLIDGGIPCREPMSFAALAGCKDVIVLEMVGPEEMTRKRWGPVSRFHGRVRRSVRNLMSQGVGSLLSLPNPPRVFRLWPSRPLDFSMLDFARHRIAPSLEQGARDAEAFLRDPARHLV
jgi:predicted acylesterase/phospholipase RssA